MIKFAHNPKDTLRIAKPACQASFAFFGFAIRFFLFRGSRFPVSRHDNKPDKRARPRAARADIHGAKAKPYRGSEARLKPFLASRLPGQASLDG
jgi:hypothetical protein